MVKLSLCRRSPTLYDGGRWVTWLNGARFKVRPLSHPAFQERLSELREPHRVDIVSDEEGEKAKVIAQQIMLRAAAYLVTDVSGIEDEDGKQVAFTHDWLEGELSKPDMEHLFRFLIDVAGNADAYTMAADLADEGNSARRSAGT